MQHTPPQLKERLLEGIDNDNNVVDLSKVLEVISILETYPITRDILEETRIGRLVNDVRRKTTNKVLAKRAKELVRGWQKLVGGGSEASPAVNGDGVKNAASRLQGMIKPQSPAISQLARSVSVNKLVSPQQNVDSSLSRSHMQYKPTTPSLQNTNNKVSSNHSTKRSNSSPVGGNASAAKKPCISPSVVNSQPPSVFGNASAAKKPCISPSVLNSQPTTPDSVCSHSSRSSYSSTNNGKLQRHPGTTYSQNRALSISSANNDESELQRTRSEINLVNSSQNLDLRASQSTSNLVQKGKSGKNGMVVSDINFNGGGGEISTPTHSIETKGLKTTIRFNKTSPPVPHPPVNGVLETPVKRGRGRPPKNKPTDQQISPQNGSVSSAKSLSEKRKVKLDIKTKVESRTDIDSPSLEIFLSKTPKVKSTAEIMQDLQAKNSLSVGKDTARQITDNLIAREPDERFVSNVPDGAKPRHHKKRDAPPSAPVSLQTKNEMVEKFLQSSVPPTGQEDLSPLKYELLRTESPGNASTSFEDSFEGHHISGHNREMQTKPEASGKPVQNVVSTVISKNTPDNLSDETKPKSSTSGPCDSSGNKQLTLEEIYSRYPPLDRDHFQLDDDSYEVDEPVEVTDADTERLHREHWSGVNGYQNHWGEWRNWGQTLTLSSYRGDFLHILPYVVTDD